MTGYTVHTGSTKRFTNGWDHIFSSPAKTTASEGGAPKKAVAKKAVAKKATKQTATKSNKVKGTKKGVAAKPAKKGKRH